ncbi:MAG: efflux RND transporter periplasmic adaptor subunit [Alistipes sp.]|nr:efflux RND transporter periplasmic adaptor subunit [Alistipes sp.]
MKKVFSLLAVVAVAAMATSCGGASDAKKAEVQEVSLPKVEVMAAQSREVVQDVVFTGNVEANVVNNIKPQQDRRIKSIRYDVGDRVKKGDLLVELDDSYLVQVKAQMENAKTEYERTNKLYEVGGASKSEWDARRLQYDVAKSSYENLLENTTMIAPISGVVSARNFDVGDMSTGAPILVIQQISPVKIMINVSETLFSKLRKGLKVYVQLDAYGDEKFEGSIARIYPTIDSSTRTFPVEVVIPNRNEKVRPGMFARVTLPYAKVRRTIVPDRAVNKLMGSGDRYVYIYNPAEGSVRYSKVELGRRLDTEFEILSGVKPGEQVVVKGQLALVNGAEVEIVNQK